MKIYSSSGIHDFIICCGYKGYVIKEYFSNYFLHMSDVTFDMMNNKMEVHHGAAEPWRITLVDTGQNTATGGRIKRIRDYLKDESCFCLTYGDGLADINIKALVDFHKSHGALATVTAVQPPARFGILAREKDMVVGFKEKPNEEDGAWVNGGFFVLNPEVLEYIMGDDTVWEKDPLENLAVNGELRCFTHGGFWQPMDTLRDKLFLDDLWINGKAPWKLWD